MVIILESNGMKIYIKDTMLVKAIKALHKELGGSITEDCREYTLTLPKKNGVGELRGANFQNGIGVFVGNFKLTKSVEIVFDREQLNPLHFNFCMEGKLTHSFNNGDYFYHLNSMMGSITADATEGQQRVRFPVNEQVVFVSIEIDRKEYYKRITREIEKLPEKLAAVFNDVKAEKSFIYQSNYSIPIAECIEEINENKHTGLIRRTFIEGKVLEIMSHIVKQYIDDTAPNGRQTVMKQYDIDRIIEAKKIIKQQLSDPPTIVELARIVGLNQQKLKKGFKLIFNTTINKYQQKNRLEKSRLLLAEGSMSIGEIAHLVGYSNGSHFSRLFKNRYGVLPRNYQKSMMQELVE